MKTKIAFLFCSILGGLEAAVLNVGSNGVVSGVDRDQSSAISALVAKARQGDEVRFDPGVYYLEHAILVKGIVALLLKVLNNHTPQEVLNADLYFIAQTGLQEHLSPTRSNGLLAMIKQIKMYALAFQAKSAQN